MRIPISDSRQTRHLVHLSHTPPLTVRTFQMQSTSVTRTAEKKRKTKRVPLTHPRGSGFRFDKRRKVITHVSTGRIIPGLLDGNAALFYPTYSYERATLDTVVSHTFNTTMTGPGESSRAAGVRTTPGSRSHRNRSVKRGNLLDTQMGRTTSYFKRYKVPHSFFFDGEVRRTWSKTDVPAHVRSYCSPYTRACWKTFAELDLSPVAWQVAVGCMRMRRGTMLDMVCRNSRGQFIVVEFKTGFNSYYYKWTGAYMRSPFHRQTDCAFNQHQLQLLMGAELYRRSFWPMESIDAGSTDGSTSTTSTSITAPKMGLPILMRFRDIDDGGVATDVHPLRPWALSAAQAAARVFEYEAMRR